MIISGSFGCNWESLAKYIVKEKGKQNKLQLPNGTNEVVLEMVRGQLVQKTQYLLKPCSSNALM